MEGDSSTRGRNMVGLLFWKNKHFGAGFEGVWEWIVFNVFLHSCSSFSLHYFSFVSCFPHRAAFKQNFSEIRIYSKHVIWAQAHCRLPMPELLTRASCRKDWMRSQLNRPSRPPKDPVSQGIELNWTDTADCRLQCVSVPWPQSQFNLFASESFRFQHTHTWLAGKMRMRREHPGIAGSWSRSVCLRLAMPCLTFGIPLRSLTWCPPTLSTPSYNQMRSE